VQTVADNLLVCLGMTVNAQPISHNRAHSQRPAAPLPAFETIRLDRKRNRSRRAACDLSILLDWMHPIWGRVGSDTWKEYYLGEATDILLIYFNQSACSVPRFFAPT
jgi:hypothetical protein